MIPSKAEFDWTLPSHNYRDPQLYERERQAIFTRHWMLFTWAERLKAPGDYVTGTLAGYPVFVMRDDEGRVRAFHNVCRHRGSRVVAGERGHCKSAVVCPFHGWSYNLDGTLRAVPKAKSFPKLDAVGHGLVPLERERFRLDTRTL